MIYLYAIRNDVLVHYFSEIDWVAGVSLSVKYMENEAFLVADTGNKALNDEMIRAIKREIRGLLTRNPNQISARTSLKYFSRKRFFLQNEAEI